MAKNKNKNRKNKQKPIPLSMPKLDLDKMEQIEMNVQNNLPEENAGHNVKRIVSQRMMTKQTKKGKKTNYIDIFSAVKKNNKSRILRHMSIKNNNNPERKSTVLVKSNGNQIKVLESVHDGIKERQRKFGMKDPESLKDVFNVQSQKIKGSKVLDNFNIKKRQNNNAIKSLITKKQRKSVKQEKKNSADKAKNNENKGIMPFIKKSLSKIVNRKSFDKKPFDKKPFDKKPYNKKPFDKKPRPGQSQNKKHDKKKKSRKKGKHRR
jgi:hypothetical protein